MIIGIGIGLFGVPMIGNLALLAALSTLFIAANLSIGYTFSTLAQNHGKVRHIGVSNVSVAQLGEATAISVVSVQNAYNLARRRSEDVLEVCEQQGIVFIPHSPDILAPRCRMDPAAPWSAHRRRPRVGRQYR